MTFDNISITDRKQILENQLRAWNNEQYLASINHSLAIKLENENMKKNATDRARECEIAIVELQQMIEELKGDNGDAT